MTWQLGHCPYYDPVSRGQERTEEGLQRELEQAAAERFAEHEERKDKEDNEDH
jgi:hypothetical protein